MYTAEEVIAMLLSIQESVDLCSMGDDPTWRMESKISDIINEIESKQNEKP